MKNKKTLIFLLVMITCITFCTTVSAGELKQEGDYWVGEINKQFQTKNTGTLVMDDINGDITISAWGKNEVSVKEEKRMDIFSESEAKTAMEKSETGIRQEGNKIIISGPGFSRIWIRSVFRINLPAGFSCDIETKGGLIDISGLNGDVKAKTGGGKIILADLKSTAVVSTGGGNISVKNVSGDVSASSGGGSIAVSDVGGKLNLSTGGGAIQIKHVNADINVSTGGGEIKADDIHGELNVSTGGGEIDLENINGSIKANTGGGEINLENIKGSIKASTGGGDVSAEVTLTDFSVEHSVKLSTGGGNIYLSIPAKLPATIEAEIANINNWRKSRINSDFPLTINEEGGSVKGYGDINGGGDSIGLRTGGGDINIKKQ